MAGTQADGEARRLREELAREREQLASDIATLRRGTDVRRQLADRLPLLAVAAFAAGFVIAGGVGAAARLMLRRNREGREVSRFGRYVLVDRG